jgi:enterochelin esterase-like enzyme
MSRLMRSLTVGCAALGVILLGALGTYGYAQDYNLHRGFASVVQLPRAGTGRLLDVRFNSGALHRRADYMVYLPPGYSAARRYPVYYLLHGMPGQPHVFVTIANLDVRLDNLLSTRQTKPMILVFPDGRIGGNVYSDSEWANTPSGEYENYVLDVMDNVDARFSTLPYRQDRVIGGFSAGAYGAINIALHHLSDFASVQVWSGYFTETRSGVFAHASGRVLAYNSPIEHVVRVSHAIRAHGLGVYMFVGRDDDSRVQLLPMVARLRAAGATVSYAFDPGGHDWSVWYPRLNAMLILASHDMDRPIAPPQTAGHSSAVSTSHGDRGGRPGSGGARRRPAAATGQGRRRTPIFPVRHHPPSVAARIRRRPVRAGRAKEIAALLLALVSGALINIGFVLQQRGVQQARHHDGSPLSEAFRNRTWLAGQGVGWVGFAGQVIAVALAPLTLVQAFAAGSLALSIPLAARIFGRRAPRAHMTACAVVGICLILLAVGSPARHPHLTAGILIGLSLAGLALAAALARAARGPARALAAGICYGIADAAIKADAIGLRHHGPAALLSGWVILAAAATLAGFLGFQSALRSTDAVRAVSVMNVLTAVTACAFGMLAFGESLGTSPAWDAVHVLAMVAVLACVAPLARDQEALCAADELRVAASSAGVVASPTHLAGERWTGRSGALTRAVASLVTGVAVGLLVIVGAVTATGLLYDLRGAGWLTAGPRVPDALPLLQLAGFAGQPAARLVAAYLLTGAALSPALRGIRPAPRAALVALIGALTLLLASDASFALARNLRLVPVLDARVPGVGAWLEALLLAAGAALPSVGRTATSSASRWVIARRNPPPFLRCHRWPDQPPDLHTPRPISR